MAQNQFCFLVPLSSLPGPHLSSSLGTLLKVLPLKSPITFQVPNRMAAVIPCKLLAAFMAFAGPVHSRRLSSVLVSMALPLFFLLQPLPHFLCPSSGSSCCPGVLSTAAFLTTCLPGTISLTLTCTPAVTNLPMIPNLTPNSLPIPGPYF